MADTSLHGLGDTVRVKKGAFFTKFSSNLPYPSSCLRQRSHTQLQANSLIAWRCSCHMRKSLSWALCGASWRWAKATPCLYITDTKTLNDIPMNSHNCQKKTSISRYSLGRVVSKSVKTIAQCDFTLSNSIYVGSRSGHLFTIHPHGSTDKLPYVTIR